MIVLLCSKNQVFVVYLFTNVIKCQLNILPVWLNKVKSCKIQCFVLKIPLRQY